MEQYYSGYPSIMTENSLAFVNMLGTDTNELVPAIRFLLRAEPSCPYLGNIRGCPAQEMSVAGQQVPVAREVVQVDLDRVPARLRERLSGRAHIQILPLKKTVLLQQGLRAETSHHLCEHHPATLDEVIDIVLRFDHGTSGVHTPSVTYEWEKTATCHNCREIGHIASNYPNTKK